ncbi:MAG: hypothetical protein IJY79_01640 [Clostridia bacterium]|nr:hypothetical protein [Clostridia bacterium]
MVDNKETFTEIVNAIANEKHSFGNKLLYDMCDPKKPGQEWENPAILADKIWLIGRAYAASPERRYTSNGEKSENPEDGQDKKIKEKNPKAGDGTGGYFSEIANIILKDNKCIESNLSEQKYNFDFSDSDCKILENCINKVSKFNDAVMQASEEYDEEYAKNMKYKNQISFCSKFLHFHFPDTVFIIDGFSKAGASFLVSNATRTNVVLKQGNSQVKIDNKNKPKGILEFLSENGSKCKTFCEQIKKVDWEKPQVKEYALHCLNAYKTAYIIKKILGGKAPETSYPRVVDTLLLKVKPNN